MATLSGAKMASSIAAALMLTIPCSALMGSMVGDVITEQKVVASDGAANDRFGLSVGTSGETVVVGAFRDKDNGLYSGSVYIFGRDGNGEWAEVAKLSPSDGEPYNMFGAHLSISGERMVISSHGDNDNGDNSGSAYVFDRNDNGEWMEVAKLIASDGAGGDHFGNTLAISGDTVVVGAYRDDVFGEYSGSAYVFERNDNGDWPEVAKLTASDGAERDWFGRDVSISGETVVVGAWGDDDNGDNSGSAYVFERDDNGEWSEVAKLIASDGTEDDSFGGSVAISGDTMVISAFHDGQNGYESGSAYIFERSGKGWFEVAKLVSQDVSENDNFGTTVSISGEKVVVGAPGNDDNGNNSGSAYIFKRNRSGSWSEVAKLNASDGEDDDRFGGSASIAGETVVVGAHGDDDQGPGTGSAYIFGFSPCPADLSGDGEVNGEDLGLLFVMWGPCSDRSCPADLSGDGEVDGTDLGLLFAAWGSCSN
ncbi:MAG: hypothetical protein MK085_04335 [Phycisphaerales bacterium]|nr:hypothetical protein [Phycisphaerales bacterium]